MIERALLCTRKETNGQTPTYGWLGLMTFWRMSYEPRLKYWLWWFSWNSWHEALNNFLLSIYTRYVWCFSRWDEMGNTAILLCRLLTRFLCFYLCIYFLCAISKVPYGGQIISRQWSCPHCYNYVCWKAVDTVILIKQKEKKTESYSLRICGSKIGNFGGIFGIL